MTMTEYIERELAIEALSRGEGCGNVCRRSIERILAADVAPVRHGQWEPGNPICPVCGENKFKDLDADIWCDWLPDYCPNCGAKMDLEE